MSAASEDADGNRPDGQQEQVAEVEVEQKRPSGPDIDKEVELLAKFSVQFHFVLFCFQCIFFIYTTTLHNITIIQMRLTWLTYRLRDYEKLHRHWPHSQRLLKLKS